MQFIFHKDAKNETLIIESELHKYIFKVRRHNIDKELYFRNLKDKNIYKYKILSIDRRKTTLELIDFKELIIEPLKQLHIGWCIIDFKSIEKNIASLNELGVTKITFIKCEYSQNYKINYEKLNKLLINSSQQSGRSNIIELNSCNSLDDFIKENPNSYMFNFSKNSIDNKKSEIDTIILGCEGGFSNNEISKFKPTKIVGIDSNIILRSETAIITIASKILV